MFKDEGVIDVDLLADFVVHGIDIGLVDSHTFLCQGRGIVDRDVMELGMVLPVFI